MILQEILNDRLSDSKDFFKWSLNDLAHPSKLKDSEKAFQILDNAIKNKKKITIAGDADADGMTAAYITASMLKKLNADFNYYIPNRDTEGIGLTGIVQTLYEMKTDLILTVDCSVRNNKEVEFAKKLGMDVIITDHHLVPEILPPADAVINPKRSDCGYPEDMLAGAGVAFQFCRLLSEKYNVPIDDYDIIWASFGTIGDRVPFTKENHIIAHSGYNLIEEKKYPPVIEVLIEMLLEKGVPLSGEILYSVFASLCRTDNFENGTCSLMESMFMTDKEEIRKVLTPLVSLYYEFEDEKQEIINRVNDSINPPEGPDDFILYYDSEISNRWTGVIASALSKIYGVPSLVLLKVNNDEIKGEGRAPKGYNFLELFDKLQEFFSGYGGHKQAAGFSLPYEKINEFLVQCKREAEDIEWHPIEEKVQTYNLNFDEIDNEFLSRYYRFLPFSLVNKRPVFESSLDIKLPEGLRFSYPPGKFKYKLNKRIHEDDFIVESV